MYTEQGEPKFETINKTQLTPEQIEVELQAQKVIGSVGEFSDIQTQQEEQKVLLDSTETEVAATEIIEAPTTPIAPEVATTETIESSVDSDVLKAIEKVDAEAKFQTEAAEKAQQEQAKEQEEADARSEISEIFGQNDRQEINEIIDINIGKEGFQRKLLSGEPGYLTKDSINLALDKYIGTAGGTSEHEKMLLFKKTLEYYASATEMGDDTEPNWHNTDSYSLRNSLDNGPAEGLDEADRIELATEAEQPFACQIALKETSEQKGLQPDESRNQAESLKNEAITGEDMKEVRVPANETQKVQSWFEKKGLSEVKVVPIEFFEIKKVIQANIA